MRSKFLIPPKPRLQSLGIQTHMGFDPSNGALLVVQHGASLLPSTVNDDDRVKGAPVHLIDGLGPVTREQQDGTFRLERGRHALYLIGIVCGDAGRIRSKQLGMYRSALAFQFPGIFYTRIYKSLG